MTCHLDDRLPDENPFGFKLCVGALHGSDTIYPSVEIALEWKLVDSGTSYCMYFSFHSVSVTPECFLQAYMLHGCIARVYCA